jgi:hypothetical protein
MKDSVRRRIRTAFQTTLGAASALVIAVPLMLAALEVSIPPKVYAVLAAGGAVTVAVSTGLVKVMTNPSIELLLQKRVPWLAAGEPAPLDESQNN